MKLKLDVKEMNLNKKRMAIAGLVALAICFPACGKQDSATNAKTPLKNQDATAKPDSGKTPVQSSTNSPQSPISIPGIIDSVIGAANSAVETALLNQIAGTYDYQVTNCKNALGSKSQAFDPSQAKVTETWVIAGKKVTITDVYSEGSDCTIKADYDLSSITVDTIQLSNRKIVANGGCDEYASSAKVGGDRSQYSYKYTIQGTSLVIDEIDRAVQCNTGEYDSYSFLRK